MSVTFAEYTDFGYVMIPEEKFKRIIFRAAAMAENETLGRVNEEWLTRGPIFLTAEEWELQKKNKRGICEVADLLYDRERNVVTGEAGAPISAFKNEGYSENYFSERSNRQAQNVFERELEMVYGVFFTQEQSCRRVN
jgi:hypothetical protein